MFRNRLALLGILLAGTLLADGPRFRYPDDLDTLARPAWRRDFVRVVTRNRPHPGGPIPACVKRFLELGEGTPPEFLDGRYLLNQAEGANHFYDWYLSDRPGKYEDMLSRHHRLAAVGSSGKRRYFNPNPNYPYWSDAIFPGQYRVELGTGQHPFGSSDIFYLEEKEAAALKRAGFQPYAGEIVPVTDPRGIHQVYRLTPEIPGVPPALRELTYFRRNGAIVHAAPRGIAETYYRAAAGAAMEKLRGWRNTPRAAVHRKPRPLVDDLAEYYYTAIHWMPFEGINNSVMMAQVNAILRHHGFKTLPHGSLDYMALASPKDVFKKVFWEAFREQNP